MFLFYCSSLPFISVMQFSFSVLRPLSVSVILTLCFPLLLPIGFPLLCHCYSNHFPPSLIHSFSGSLSRFLPGWHFGLSTSSFSLTQSHVFIMFSLFVFQACSFFSLPVSLTLIDFSIHFPVLLSLFSFIIHTFIFLYATTLCSLIPFSVSIFYRSSFSFLSPRWEEKLFASNCSCSVAMVRVAWQYEVRQCNVCVCVWESGK